MAHLIQACKLEDRNKRKNKKETDGLANAKELSQFYNKAVVYGVSNSEFKKNINLKIENTSKDIRINSWKDYKKLPSGYKKHMTLDGLKNDVFTELDKLYKVKTSKYIELADKFNMIITPIEYTKIDSLFDLTTNPIEMKRAYATFLELLKNDTTTNYDLYLLCPVDYYNLWENVKSKKTVPIYYPEYFENTFSTLEMLLPTQKNLYLATKTNNENITALAGDIEVNLKSITSKITKLSHKVDKIENKQIEEALKLKALSDKVDKIETETKLVEQQRQNEKIELENKILKLKEMEEVKVTYRDYDPILFAVPENVNIIEEDVTSIVGLCWGAEINTMVFDLKNVTILNSELKAHNVNDILFNSKMKKLNHNEKKVLLTKEILKAVSLRDMNHFLDFEVWDSSWKEYCYDRSNLNGLLDKENCKISMRRYSDRDQDYYVGFQKVEVHYTSKNDKITKDSMTHMINRLSNEDIDVLVKDYNLN